MREERGRCGRASFVSPVQIAQEIKFGSPLARELHGAWLENRKHSRFAAALVALRADGSRIAFNNGQNSGLR
jgi:hypothetical protein